MSSPTTYKLFERIQIQILVGIMFDQRLLTLNQATDHFNLKPNLGFKKKEIVTLQRTYIYNHYRVRKNKLHIH